MMRSLCLLVLVFALPVFAADPPGPAKDVPELKALAGYVGKFTTEGTFKNEGQNLFTVKGSSSAEWIHDGYFVRQTWAIDGTNIQPALNGSTIMTYDTKQKIYRSWLFGSTGTFGEATGTWDAKEKTMTWTAKG